MVRRLVRWVLSGISFCVVLLLLSGVAAYFLKENALPEKSILHLVVDGSWPETPSSDLEAMLEDAPPLTLFELTQTLRHAATDPRVQGLLLEVVNPEISAAQWQDFEQAMEVFRKSKKWNAAFVETIGESGSGDSAYAIAATTQHIVLAPAGEIGFTGVALQVPFFKKALDKWGITAHFGARHEYKNAVNSLTHKAFTKEHKESLQTLADDLQELFLKHISARRNTSPEQVKTWVALAPHAATEALDQGIVDALGYWDEMLKEIERINPNPDALVPFEEYAFITQQTDTSSHAHTVAFVSAEGEIHRGESQEGGLNSTPSIGSTTLTQALREAREDKVNGVLLRINSPGGSYLASDLIRREILQTQQAGIPVVVSMGSMAASGGYYIAMDANRVFAQPSTLTGSIGVFGGRFAFRHFLEETLGVTFDTYQAVEGASTDFWLDPPTPSDKEKTDAALDRIYDDFTQKAAQARSMDWEKLHAVARGRVWSGQAAYTHHLVDNLGSTYDALEYLKTLMHTPAKSPVNMVYYPAPETPLDRIKHLLHTQTSVMAWLSASAHHMALWLENPSAHNAQLPPIVVR